MDDVPAGPASTGPRRPSLSVVIPVRNGGRDFERCLRRLRDSSLTDYELIVIDDGSTDHSANLAREAGALVVRNRAPQGPAAARNLGARMAVAPLVFFVDADVAVRPQTLELALDCFKRDPSLSALFGSYDDTPAAPGIVSQYRNLLHHFVHQQGDFQNGVRAVHTFWTGCGVMRREVFLEFGGFDPRLYPRPAIEDIELGYRLTQAGHKIVIARDVQATHMKRWTLPEIVRTDIFQRGVPWMLLLKRSGRVEQDLNVKSDQKACVALTALATVALALAPISWWGPGITALCLGAILGLNRQFFQFLAQRKGLGFAAAAFPLYLLYYYCCGLSVIIASVMWQLEKRRNFSSAVTVDIATTPATPGPHASRAARVRRRWLRGTRSTGNK